MEQYHSKIGVYTRYSRPSRHSALTQGDSQSWQALRMVPGVVTAFALWLGRVDIFQTEISDEKYEQLQRILEKQNGHAYTFEETKEIGDGLIGFFSSLIEISSELETENESTLLM